MSKPIIEQVISVEDYISTKLESLNNNTAGHEWVCVEFNKSKWCGKALCIAHKSDRIREYTNI